MTEKLEQAISASGTSDVEGVPIQLNTLDAWRFFLQKGFLPWWAEERDWQAWEEKIILSIKKQRGSVLSDLKRLDVRADPVIQRLVWQFSEELLMTLIQNHRPQTFQREFQLIQDLQKLTFIWTHTTISKDESREYAWIVALTSMWDEKKEEKWRKEWISNFLSKVSIKKGKVKKELLKESCEAVLLDKPETQNLVPDYLEKILLDLWKEESNTDKADLTLNEKQSEIDQRLEKVFEIAKTREPIPKQIEHTTRPDEETSLFVQNAGIILIHPFLPTLFEELGYVKSGSFIDEVGRHRAIHLIQYLANGEFETAEPDLSLNKLLCGLPFELPVERRLDLSSREKEEAEHLLKTVVGHWKALKNTSPDGLRVNYFMREGKLAFTEMGWKLLVEQKTQDIMLGRLPWGIGVVKMPWMLDMLRVEWT